MRVSDRRWVRLLFLLAAGEAVLGGCTCGPEGASATVKSIDLSGDPPDSEVQAGRTVTLTATATPYTTVQWNFGPMTATLTQLPNNKATFVSNVPDDYSITASAQGYDSAHYLLTIKPPPPNMVAVTATPNPVGTGGTTTLSATVMGGVGPFTYRWRGYRDDGEHMASFTLSSLVAPSPQATLPYPDYSYYFFCTVTDTGVTPNTTGTGFVRVYETAGPIARVSISPATIKAAVDVVHFDGSASTGATGSFTGWSIDYGGSTVPTSLEGDLLIPTASWTNLCGTASTCGSTSLALTYGPFAQPGTYRVQLSVFDISNNSETSTEYFTASP